MSVPPPLPHEKVIRLGEKFRGDGIPFALAGAIGLVYWAEPRATVDIDINVFLPEKEAPRVFAAVEGLGVTVGENDVAEVLRSGQIRLDWAGTWLDLFFAYDAFHESCAARTVEVDFLGHRFPVLSAEDLVVFKVIFNRMRDWPDIEAIVATQGSRFDVVYTTAWLERILGEDDSRIARLRELAAEYAED